MRTMRVPTDRNDITPEMMGDLIANLRKLSNISGIGCLINELPNGISISVPQPLEEIRGRLTQDLYGCSSARAIRMYVGSDDSSRATTETFIVHDPLSRVTAELLAIADDNGELYLPVGTCFYARKFVDSGNWEIQSVGLCCDQGSGSEGSEGSGSEGSGSEEQHSLVKTFVTDVDYNSITGAWRKKTCTVKIPDGFLVGYETDWIDYILGSDAGSDIQRDATTTTCTVDAGAAFGDVTTITVTVSPPAASSGTTYGTPTGSVAFRAYYGTRQIQLHADSGSPYLAAGTGNNATATITTHLPAGIWTIMAEYGGDASYNQSTYESYNHSLETGDQFTVALAETSVTLSLDNATPIYGTPITITAYVNSLIEVAAPPGNWEKEPAGFIVFYIDDVQVGYERLTSWSFSHYGAKATLTSYSDWQKLSGGEHTIKAVYLGGQPGMEFNAAYGDGYFAASDNTATVTVGKKPLGVTGGAGQYYQGGDPGGVYSREYGEDNPAFVPGYTGFVYGQNANCLTGSPDFATAAEAASDVGIYDVTPTIGDLASDNYSFTSFLPAHLTITKAPLAVSVDDAGMVYCDTVPEFVVRITGLKLSDHEVITGTTTCNATSEPPNTSPPSDYVITVGLADTGDKLKNYWTPTLHHGLMTIAKAPLTVTADAQSMAKDATKPTLTGTISGVLNSDGLGFTGVCSADGHTKGYFTINATISDPSSRQNRYTITIHNSVLFVT